MTWSAVGWQADLPRVPRRSTPTRREPSVHRRRITPQIQPDQRPTPPTPSPSTFPGVIFHVSVVEREPITLTGIIRHLRVDDEPDFSESAGEPVGREDDRFDLGATTSASEAISVGATGYLQKDAVTSQYEGPAMRIVNAVEHKSLPASGRGRPTSNRSRGC